MTKSLVASFSILLWAVILYIPFWTGHVGVEGDGHFHHRAVVQIAEAQMQGIWYPKWLPDQRGGLGDPSFVYYPPLFHTASALLTHLMGNAWAAMKAVMMLSTACAGWIAFSYLRTLFPIGSALFGALAIEANPLPIHQMAKGGVYPANVVYPLVLLCLIILLRDKGPRWFSPSLALAFFAVTLTHVLTCFMLCLTVPTGITIYSLLRREAIAVWGRRFLKICFSIAAGICLSAFYLVPALTTMRDISPGEWLLEGVCSTNHSFLLPLLTYSSGLCWKSVQIAFPLAALIAMILAAWFLWRKHGSSSIQTGVGTLIGIGGAALFFGSELSYPLWQYDSPLQKLQFPDRFNTILLTAALLALALASLQVWRKEQTPGVRYTFSTALSLSFVFSILLVLNLSRLPLLSNISNNIEIAGDFGTPEYLPAVAQPAYRDFLHEGSFAGECRRDRVVCQTLRRSSKEFQFLIRSDRPATIDLPLFAYPAWAVYLDDTRHSTAADPSNGLIRILLPPGAHHIEVRWRIAKQQWIGFGISLGALIVILFSLTPRFSNFVFNRQTV